jgi:general secretion pathway protein A
MPLPCFIARATMRGPKAEESSLVAETFYTRFYGLKIPAFHVTPDASFFFATDTHQQAVGVIEYGVAAGKGFIVVTGEVGVGKTTVLRAVLDRMDAARARVIYLFNPDLSTGEMYAAILEGLDNSSTHRSESIPEMLRRIQEALLTFNERGIPVILAVDEAQNMPENTLEHLRVLSNLETSKTKLLQIILVGQPELDVLLLRPSLRQLAQRIAVRARISRLTYAQSRRYVLHRLACCGRSMEPPLFTAPALWYLAWRARGIPRSLNILCDNALINGYGQNSPVINLDIAREASRSLRPTRKEFNYGGRAMVALFLLLLVGGVSTQVWHGATHGLGAIDHAKARDSQVGATTSMPPSPASSPMPDVVTPSPKLEPDPLLRSGTTATVADAAADAHESVQPSAPIENPARSTQDPAPPAMNLENPVQSTQAPAPPAKNLSDSATASLNDGPTTWIVEYGDSLYRACRVTYGHCSPAEVKAVIAANPRIRSSGILWPGDHILLPPRSQLLTQ